MFAAHIEGMSQWLRIEPENGWLSGTEDIALDFSYSSITYTHEYGETTGMPRKEVSTSAGDQVQKTFYSYLEVSVVNMFKDQGGRPGLGVGRKTKKNSVLKRKLCWNIIFYLSQFNSPNTTQSIQNSYYTNVNSI